MTDLELKLTKENEELKVFLQLVADVCEQAEKIVIYQREVLRELDECAAYWSEYDVPLGIHDRIKKGIIYIPMKDDFSILELIEIYKQRIGEE